VTTENETYWQSGAEDESMQKEHGFIWRAMLETLDVDLTGRRVLDAGCNRGGFLRLLASEARIAVGYGYDPASGAIADARRLAGDLPLVFEVAETVPGSWDGFDVAFSHEVLYLIHDLSSHAAAIHRSLVPGGVYYAVMGVHADTPGMADWHARNAERLNLPPLYALDDVIGSFAAVGFEPAVSRLKMGFVPVSDHAPSFPTGLEYFYEHKLMLRLTKPAGERERSPRDPDRGSPSRPDLPARHPEAHDSNRVYVSIWARPVRGQGEAGRARPSRGGPP
jgi:SAM-dependent methyltransferase